MARRKVSLSLLVLQLAIMLVALFGPASFGAAQAATIANPAWPFLAVWERTDYPVAVGAASRSWYWGPAPFATLTENYAEASGGSRQIYYYDKSRMEITNPNGDPSSKYFVTNGLLVKEMITGKLQLGDNSFQTNQPAEIPVSGDGPATNPVSPTYASFSNLTDGANQSTDPISATLDRSGQTGSNSDLASRYPETAPVYFNSQTGHNVPSVMWRFMNLQGIVSRDRQLVSDKIEDWLYSFGLPITEAYWTRSVVGGVEKDVLVQLFERRVLTYTPTNPAAYQLEMGNVGLHYYNWRYADTSPKPGEAQSYSQPPVRLSIPSINVNARIEYVGIKSDGNMDVPVLPQDVGLYRFGASIGDVGNAVIAGHLDYYNVGPAVFWDLGKLKPGDTVEVYTSQKTKLTFQVNDVQIYPDAQFPRDTVFGGSGNRNLNLVTCEGSFDPVSSNYNRRLVVYTTLVP